MGTGGAVDEEPTKQDLLLPILTELVETVKKIESHQKGQFALLQQQMTTVEAQLNTTTIWASRAYTANLDPAARQAALDESKEQAQKLADEIKAEEDALLMERATRGVGNGGDAVTEADIAWWRDDDGR